MGQLSNYSIPLYQPLIHSPISIPKAIGFRGVSCDTCMSRTDQIWQSKQITLAVLKPSARYKTEWISQILEKGLTNDEMYDFLDIYSCNHIGARVTHGFCCYCGGRVEWFCCPNHLSLRTPSIHLHPHSDKHVIQ